MLKFPLRGAVGALVLLVVSGAAAQQPAQPATGAAADPVVARVDGAEVRLSDVVAMQRSLPEQYRQMPLEQIFPTLRQQLVDTLLIASAAHAAGIDREPAVAKRLKAAAEDTLREVYLGRIITEAVTDEALKKQYEALKARLAGEQQIRASHILVRTEREAKEIITALAKPGADFAALARKKSVGPSSAQGGDLGFFSRGDMVKPFADAAYALEPGQVTKTPVKTQFGWHVIRLEERRPAPVPAYEEVEDQLRDQVARAAINDFVKGLRAKSKVEQFGVDGAPERPSGIRAVPR